MGFDLKQMIADLEQILAAEGVPDKLIIEATIERLAWWKEYAKECGDLNA